MSARSPVLLPLALALLAFVPAPGHGTTWIVDPVNPTLRIQDALDQAAPGDVVELMPGNHRYWVSRTVHGWPASAVGILKSGVTIRSQAGPEVTFVDGQGFVHGFLGEGLDSTTVIEGISFVDCISSGFSGNGLWGGALLLYDSVARIRNNRFLRCEAHGGAAVFLHGGSGAVVSGNVFDGNLAGQLGGAVELYLTGATRLENNTFVRNTAIGAGGAVGSGGAIAFNTCSAILDRNIFWNNFAEQGGGAIRCLHETSVDASCNLFWSNHAETGDDVTACAPLIGLAGNEVLNPLFCDALAGDFRLSAESPALPAWPGGCGAIGALGPGCPALPEAALPVTALDFGSVPVGFPKTLPLLVMNTGTDTLSVDLLAEPGAFTASPASALVPPEMSSTFEVTFDPTLGQAYIGTLHLATNDPAQAAIDVGLTGRATVPPDIAVSSQPIEVVLTPGRTAVVELPIANESGGDLVYELVVESRDPAWLSVLLIDDLLAPGPVASALAAAGHEVTTAFYAFWDGTNPPPGSHDLVVLDAPFDPVFGDMPAAGQEALLQYLEAGGGMVAFGRPSAVLDKGLFGALAPVLPLGFETFAVLDDTLGVLVNHPVTARIPSGSVLAGCPTVLASGSAGEILVAGSGSGDAVVSLQVGDGRVVQLAASEQDVAAPNPHVVAGPLNTILGNAVRWVGLAVPWARTNPAYSVLAAPGTAGIQVLFDASGRAPGTYEATLHVASNDPDEGRLPIRLRLVVLEPTSVDGPLAPSSAFSVRQNYPNPFSRRTTIPFSLPAEAPVEIRVFDVAGRLVGAIPLGHVPAGSHTFSWDGLTPSGRRIGPGVYFYRVDAGAHAATRKLIVVDRPAGAPR